MIESYLVMLIDVGVDVKEIFFDERVLIDGDFCMFLLFLDDSGCD